MTSTSPSNPKDAIPPLLIIFFLGIISPGCTAIGAAVGSTFNEPIDRDPASVGPEIVGEFVEVIDRRGEIHGGQVIEILDGAVVIEDTQDLFAHATAETLSIAHMAVLQVEGNNSGLKNGLMLGLIADVIVATYAATSLSAFDEDRH